MRKAFKGYLFSFFVLAALLISLSGTSAAFARTSSRQAASHNTALSCPGWNVVSSPNVNANPNLLSGTVTISANDVWAVGYYDSTSNDIYSTLTEHWNGTSWSIVPSPNIGTSSNYLYAVAAVSSNDVWAVGQYNNGGYNFGTLTEHWDGTSWSIVFSPNLRQRSNTLESVAAISTNDVWAVGGNLIEHWDGTKWNIVSSPIVGSVSSVTAVPSKNVWAVGFNGSNTLIEHWNGTSWNAVASPNVGSYLNYLVGVSAVSSNDVWAVGYYSNNITNEYTLIEQWNGTSWSIVSSPNPDVNTDKLYSVAAVSANDVWAVGYSNYGQTLTEQWNGTNWSAVPSPNVGSSFNVPQGVAAVSANRVVLVGYYTNVTFQTLIEFYC